MFGIKKKGGAPPDVGEEDKFEEANKEGAEKEDKGAVPELNIGGNAPIASGVPAPGGDSIGDSQMNIRIEQLNAKLETISNWMKQVYERFSYISESIGEMRSANLNNEKQIVKAIKDSAQASELVKEVQPEALRLDYKKATLRMDVLDEKLESSKQFVDSVLEQFKDIQRKAEVFIGTEGVLKLNEDTQKELIEVQKLASRARLDADKSEQIFMELKKSLTDMQKMSSEFASFNNISTLMKKDIEKIRVDHSKVISDDEFAELKKMVNRKFNTLDSHVGTITGIKQTNERSTDLIEKILRITKANQENIDSLAFTIGNDSNKRVSDYEGQVDGILKLVDSLAGQVSEIRKHIGLKSSIAIPKTNQPLISENTLKMQNISVPKNIIKQIVPKTVPVAPKMVSPPVAVKKVEVKKVNAGKKVAPPAIKSSSPPANLKTEYPEDKEMAVLQKRIAKLSEEL